MTSNVLAIPAFGSEPLGLITYWSLSGTINLEAFSEHWKAAGLNTRDLPKPPSEMTLLRRVLNEVRDGRQLVRSLAKPVGVALVQERAQDSDLEYEVLARAYPSPFRVESFNSGLEMTIRERFFSGLSEVASAAFGAWLVQRVDTSSGVPLRETGGLYFIPRHCVQGWQRLAKVVEQATQHRVLQIPAVSCEESATAVLDAVVADANASIARMTEALASGDLGHRALATKEDDCAAAAQKLAAYEKLLGVRLDSITVALTELKANLTAAKLLAMDEAKAPS